LSQSIAAARALGDWQAVAPPVNGALVTALAGACENALDHLTHFTLFFMPDFARASYRSFAWFTQAHRRFQAGRGVASRRMSQARARFLHVIGILTGKWPHSLALHPGGVTQTVGVGDLARLTALITEFRHFLEETFYGLPLETFCAFETMADLITYQNAAQGERCSDVQLFLQIADSLDLGRQGRLSLPFMSFGQADPVSETGSLFRPGVLHHGGTTSPTLSALDLRHVQEHVHHSWFEGDTYPPYHGQTVPHHEKATGYSWSKAPRYQDSPVEVGAIARQALDGQALILDLLAQEGGSSVRGRVVARLLELARLVLTMERWVAGMRLKDPFYHRIDQTGPQEGAGLGITEAARGALGHWLQVEKGRIANYQIIAPTSWNFSPRDGKGQAGPVEQALLGSACPEKADPPVMIQHIIRSFDPCMVCTAH